MPLSQPDAEKMRVHLFTAMRNLMEAMEVFILVDKSRVDRDVEHHAPIVKGWESLSRAGFPP